MSEPLFILIAVRAIIGTLAILTAILAVLSVTSAIAKRPSHPGDIIGRVIGAAIIFAIPVGIAAAAGAVASALLLAIGAPPPTYIFVAFAAIVSFRTAVRHPSHGMEGCTKMFGLVASGYAIVWSIVSFDATGGFGAMQAGDVNPRWLQPPLAALPFAVLILHLTDKKKRSAWLFIGTLAFVGALMALCFFPIEVGFASPLLPHNAWLRFPLVGLALAALFFLIRLAFIARAKPNIRKVRLRDLRRDIRLIAAILFAMGLSWAAAHALVGAL